MTKQQQQYRQQQQYHRKMFFAILTLAAAIVTVTAEPATTELPVTPTGIFTLQPQFIDDPGATAYDDIDDYVPYRSDKHDQFSWELLKAVLQGEQQNVIISPFSVKLVLAILSEATGNNTQSQKELISTLTDIKSPDNLRDFYKKTLTSLKKENPYYILNLETKLYTDKFIEPLQKYAAVLHNFYQTDIESLYFSDSRTAAQRINAWCSNVTHGRLQQLITEDNIENNVMLMANVIYFKGLWRRPFNDTFQGAFFKTPTEQVKVDYMEQTEYFYHYDSNDLDAKILRLPYKGKKFAMFILLPKTKAGVDELTRSMENNQLKRMQWMMEEVKVKVTLPKFKFEFKKKLKDTLKRLGINDIFTNHASLPGLARGADVAQKLKVSDIFQKAGIEINEKGTEAFASTVVEIENKFGGSTVIEEFNVNRPFLFFIEEQSTGNIVFAGKVIEPLV